MKDNNNLQSRIMLASPGSGCGKTTITCAFLYGLKSMGKKIGALKCGPDYIDPLFHRRVLGIETGNLDLFMSDEQYVKENLINSCEKNDITIIEGAMGYFDGIGMTEEASAYDIARKTETPVILIIDGKGMARSIVAIVDGFLANDCEKNIKGILVNNTTETVWQFAKTEFNKRGIAPIGWIPRLKTEGFSSRHLGLITPDEINDFNKIIGDIYNEIKGTIDWKLLNEIAAGAKILSSKKDKEVSENKKYSNLYLASDNEDQTIVNSRIKHDLTIAIARDEAFCFYYDENIQLLEQFGCKVVYFSPLYDEILPEKVDGLILWGGYPELYNKELTANKSMITSVRTAIEAGIPVIAECGGFLYLQKTLDGEEMVGIFNGDAKKEDRLNHFGYINMELKSGATLFSRDNMRIKAHEFHYCHINNEGNDFIIKKASGTKKWEGVVANDNIYAGFPHIFFPGNIDFLKSYLEKCIQSRTNVRKGLRFTR